MTRVFLHAGVSLNDVQFSLAHAPREYNALWKFLKNLPPLQGKSFPERSSLAVWEAALGDFQRGPRAVYMAGKLRYNTSADSGPLFRFQLEPLRQDYSHRSGRRFGHDRFFEIDIPNLTGRQLPKALEHVGHLVPQVVIQWLVDEQHCFMERTWRPFYIKPKDRKDRKAASGKSSTDDPEPVHRIYFFATDGRGFRDCGLQLELSHPHAKISIEVLLDCIRPTFENALQSYLKLFARTSLGKKYSPQFYSDSDNCSTVQKFPNRRFRGVSN